MQLLNRSTRSFALTSAGEDILGQAHILMNTLGDIQNIADSYQSEPKGIIRITSSIFFGQHYLQPVINQFMKRYPNVKVTVSLDDRKADIISDHFDVAFRVGRLAESNLIAKKIAKTRFAIVASKEFIDQYGTPSTPEELVALPAVIFSNGDTSFDIMCLSQLPHGDQFKNYKMQGNLKVSDVSGYRWHGLHHD